MQTTQQQSNPPPVQALHSVPDIGSGLLIILFLIGCVASTFKAMMQKASFKSAETWGRIGSGGVLSMAAAATPLVFTGASNATQCGIAAALAIFGDAFVMAIIKKRFGVDDEQVK